MASILSTAAASILAHNLPLAGALQGLLSSAAGALQWPAVASQQIHSVTCWVNDQACYMCCHHPACNLYTCCMAGGLLPTCLMVCCHPMVVDLNEQDYEVISSSVKSEPIAVLISEDLPSLIDQDDIFADDDD